MRKYVDDENIIQAFLCNYKIVDIMHATKLSKNTIYKLKNDSEFQAVLQKRRGQVVKAAVGKLSAYLLKDLDAIQAIIDDEETSPQVKINAVQLLLGQLKDWTVLVDFTERLERLECSKSDENATV